MELGSNDSCCNSDMRANNDDFDNDCSDDTRSQSSRPIAPIALSVEQNKLVTRLWITHSRVLVDVPISSEDENTGSPPFTMDTYNIIVRLYGFILAYLEANINLTSLSSTQDVAINNLANTNCLRPFTQLALSSIKTDNNSCERSFIIKKVVRLLEGRHVLNLHHEDFMNELNLYENGGTNPSDEFIQIRSFGSFLYFFPHWALPAFGCAVALAMIALFELQQRQLIPSIDSNRPNEGLPYRAIINRFIDRTQIIIKFINVYPQIQMMDIKTGLNGKFVSLKGHVVKVRPKRLRLATADFKCNTCGTIISHSFTEGRYSFPNKCFSSNKASVSSISGDTDNAKKTSSCRSKTFTFVRPTARYISVQEIRLQEVQDEDSNAVNMMQAGRTPKQIEVELAHSELVNICRPGDIVLVAGTVAAINTAVAAGSKGRKTVQETSTYKLYVVGHSITTMSESNDSHKKRKSTTSNQQQHTKFTQLQLRNIVQLCHADHKCFSLVERRAFPFDLLVRSLCPSIIGHHAVKAGLLLCLLGGTPSQSSSMIEKGNAIRSNSHILIVGDPGMGTYGLL
jgi:MCM OB domain/MCM P-loop domain